jgi:hypothetical protein
VGPAAIPSEAARAQLRDEAAALDVEDLVDVCCAVRHDRLRTGVYLEALRKKSGEKAQLGACLLCFDLAKHGDERAHHELHLLFPVIDGLLDADPRGIVAALTAQSDAVLELWTELATVAVTRDRRAPALVPDFDNGPVEVALFDDSDFDELAGLFDQQGIALDVGVDGGVALAEIDLDAEDVDVFAADVFAASDRVAALAFDRALDALWRPGQPLFVADSAEHLERLEQVQAQARSFSAQVPLAGETQALAALFVASHTRALGLFSRRNKVRDAQLSEALTTFVHLAEPPAAMAAWFIDGGDIPGCAPFSWDKMAEVLLDFCAFVGARAEETTGVVDVDDAVRAYVKDPRSARVPPVLGHGERRRR